MRTPRLREEKPAFHCTARECGSQNFDPRKDKHDSSGLLSPVPGAARSMYDLHFIDDKAGNSPKLLTNEEVKL